MSATSHSWRFWLLALACAALAATFMLRAVERPRDRYEAIAVIDVTRSMNVRDYVLAGEAASRLDFVKAGLRAFLLASPCQSRLGLAIFTNRQSFLLFEPLEVCENFAPITGTLDALDWRMAWQGDSGIAYGLNSAHELATDLGADLFFLTDGQEAPPLPSFGPPQFRGEAGAVQGVIGGIGGIELAPIPKYDEDGREIGFLDIDDVPHESRLGPPPEDAHLREGWHPRNAPWGSEAVQGNEHLSAVREDYLRKRAEVTGLSYRHLETAGGFVEELQAAVTPRPATVLVDLRWIPAALALICLLAVYGLPPVLRLAGRRRSVKSQRRIKHDKSSHPRRRIPGSRHVGLPGARADAPPDRGERRHLR